MFFESSSFQPGGPVDKQKEYVKRTEEMIKEMDELQLPLPKASQTEALARGQYLCQEGVCKCTCRCVINIVI